MGMGVIMHKGVRVRAPRARASSQNNNNNNTEVYVNVILCTSQVFVHLQDTCVCASKLSVCI